MNVKLGGDSPIYNNSSVPLSQKIKSGLDTLASKACLASKLTFNFSLGNYSILVIKARHPSASSESPKNIEEMAKTNLLKAVKIYSQKANNARHADSQKANNAKHAENLKQYDGVNKYFDNLSIKKTDSLNKKENLSLEVVENKIKDFLLEPNSHVAADKGHEIANMLNENGQLIRELNKPLLSNFLEKFKPIYIESKQHEVTAFQKMIELDLVKAQAFADSKIPKESDQTARAKFEKNNPEFMKQYEKLQCLLLSKTFDAHVEYLKQSSINSNSYQNDLAIRKEALSQGDKLVNILNKNPELKEKFLLDNSKFFDNLDSFRKESKVLNDVNVFLNSTQNSSYFISNQETLKLYFNAVNDNKPMTAHLFYLKLMKGGVEKISVDQKDQYELGKVHMNLLGDLFTNNLQNLPNGREGAIETLKKLTLIFDNHPRLKTQFVQKYPTFENNVELLAQFVPQKISSETKQLDDCNEVLKDFDQAIKGLMLSIGNDLGSKYKPPTNLNELRNDYKQLGFLLHPDKHPEKAETLTAAFQKMTNIYEEVNEALCDILLIPYSSPQDAVRELTNNEAKFTDLQAKAS